MLHHSGDAHNNTGPARDTTLPIFWTNKHSLLLVLDWEREAALCDQSTPSSLGESFFKFIYDVDILFIFNFTAIKQNIKHLKYLSLLSLPFEIPV